MSADVKSEYLKLVDLMSYFFVSRPESGRREGFEYQRIVYFNPEDQDLSKQTDAAGIAEAFINFTENFRKKTDEVVPEYDHRFVKSTKLLEIFVQVENREFIIGLALNRDACNKADYFVHMQSIKALVIRIYETFRLFYGSFSALFRESRGFLMQRLDQFFSHYLALLRVHQIPLIDLFSGVGFMNIGSIEYLQVQCLISRLTEQFPEIKKTIFLYQDKLVQYSVEKDDVIVLYRYLTQHLVQSAVFSELKPIGASARESEFVGKFITGAVDFVGQETPKEGPTVFLTKVSTKELQCYSLVVYRALNATLCLFVRADEMPKLDLSQLQQSLDPELARLASNIGDLVPSSSRAATSDMQFHYVYYNPDSLSLKTSFVDEPNNPNTVPMPPASIYRLVCETFDHFIETDVENFAQVEVKADNDWWVIVKKNNGRILTLFIQRATSTTIEDIHEIVEQILKLYFPHLFIV